MADGAAIINEGKGVFTVKSGTQPTISGKGKGISNSAVNVTAKKSAIGSAIYTAIVWLLCKIAGMM